MQKLVWQNAKGDILDLTSGNYGITEWEGFSNTSLNIQTQSVPFQDGAVFLDALMEQRELSVTLAMQDKNNLELRYQQRRELISALNPKLGEGYLIYTNNFVSKRIKCIPQIPLFETHNSDTAGTPKASLSWTACEPYWEDLEDVIIEINSGETKIVENTGDVPVPVKLEIPSGSLNPAIINMRNDKMLSLQYLCKDKVIVTTDVGKKRIYGGEIVLELLEGGSVRDGLYIGNHTFLFVGSSIWLYNELTDELEVTEAEGGLKKVIFANNLYVGIGVDGVIQTSPDGRNWTTRNSGTTIDLNSIIYAENKFIIVGGNYSSSGITTPTSGIMLSSTDGITWQNITFESNIAMSQIIYVEGTGYFVSGSFSENSPWTGMSVNSGVIYYSSDLTTWTRKLYLYMFTSDLKNTTVVSILYAQNKYFALAGNYHSNSYDMKLLTSDDGMTWSSWNSSQNFTNVTFYEILYMNNIFIITSYARIQTSPDGTTWTTVDIPVDFPTIRFTQDKYFCFYKDVYFSTDLVNWELMKKISFDYTIRNIVLYHDKIIGTVTGGIVVSEDGVNFTFQSLTNSGQYITCINDLLIVSGGSKIYTSTDGITWEGITPSISVEKIIYAQDKYVSKRNLIFYTSEDLTTWTEMSTIGNMSGAYDFIYSEISQSYIVVGYYRQSTTNYARIQTSPDLVNWTEQSYNQYRQFDRIFCENNHLIIFGTSSSNLVLVSTDGVNWSLQNNGMNGNEYGYFYKIRYINGLYIIVGLSRIYVSSDCVNWERVGVPTTSAITDFTYLNDKYVFLGSVLVNSILSDNNLISFLTKDSDMTFCLERGENNLNYLNENNKSLLLSYRNKYIGV